MVPTILVLLLLAFSGLAVAGNAGQSVSGSDLKLSFIYLSEAIHETANPGDLVPYYALSVGDTNFTQNQALTVSVISTSRTFISIYINILPEGTEVTKSNLPGPSNSQIDCSDQNIITCPIFQLQPNQIIVIGLYIRDPVQYILLADQTQIKDLKLTGEIEKLELTDRFAAIFTLNLTQLESKEFQEIVTTAEYSSMDYVSEYKMFTIRAGPVPSNPSQEFMQKQRSFSVGGYSQQIVLFNTSQCYYIILTGQSGLSLTLSAQKPTNQIQLSIPISYLYDSSISTEVNQIKQFTFNTKDSNVSQYGVYINKLRGEGSVVVSVCSFWYNFTDQLGFSEYVVIHKDVLDCKNPVISVKLANITFQLGVRIIVEPYDQIQDDQTLYFSEQRVQVLHSISTECTSYQIQSLPDAGQQHVILRYFTTIQNPNFMFKICKKSQSQQNCTPISIKEPNYYLINNISDVAEVQVCTNQSKGNYSNLYYGILISVYPEIKIIDLEHEIMDIVSSDQIILYKVNGVYKKNANSTLQIRVKLINGEIVFNQNCSDVINRQFCHDNNQYDAWHYSASYNLSQIDPNELENIKFGITGKSESIYSVIAYINENIPQPEPQPEPPAPTPKPISMVYLQDGANNITITKDPVLYFYQSHIIPYNLSIPSSENLCIEQFQNLAEIDQTPLCSNTSNIFKSGKFLYDSLYLRISPKAASTDPTELSINVTVPYLTISNNQFVMLSCAKYCYSVVKIVNFNWNSESVISVYGPGYLNSTTESNLTKLKFTSLPFTFTAILPEGGDLYIQIMDDNLNVITKNKRNFRLDYFTPLRLIVPVQDIDASTLLINSFGRKFSGTWRLNKFNISQQNTMRYTYPDTTDQPVYKSPPYASSSTPLTLQNGIENEIPLQCRTQSKQLACFYTVFLKNAEESLDLLNDNGDIVINLNNNLEFLPPNMPTIGRNDFSVTFYDAILLLAQPGQDGVKSDSSDLKINQNLVSIQPRSACGTMSASIISSSLVFGESPENSNLVQVYSTQPCSYNLAITSCPLPMIFSSTPMEFTFNAKNEYLTIFTPSSDSNDFNIHLWMNLTSYKEESKHSKLIVSVYQVMNHSDCTSSKNILVSTTEMSVSGSVPIYFTSAQANRIAISLQSSLSNLYLIRVSEQTPSSQRSPMAILVRQNEMVTLLPNSEPQPVYQSQQSTIYTYESAVNNWQLCYFLISGSDSQNNVSLTIRDSLGVSLDRVIKMNEKESCVNVVSPSQGFTNYSVSVKYSKIPKEQILYIYTKQYVQSVQTNHPHTPIFQPQSLLLSPLNSKYGYCYNYDINNIQNNINIIFYPTTPLSTAEAANASIFVPGTILEQLYDIKQIRSFRTGKIISFEVVVRRSEFKEDNVGVCFKYDQPFFTKIIDEFEGFKILFNEQQDFKNIMSEPNMTAIGIFKFVDLSLASKSSAKQWLVTEVIQCDSALNGSLTLLGSYTLNDIILGNIAQYQQIYNKYNVLASLAALDGRDHFFIGIKYTGLENITYSINTYKISEKALPHTKWNISNGLINASQSVDKKHLIVQLPPASTNLSTNGTLLNYTVYVISRQNATIYNASTAHIRCPGYPETSNYLSKANVSIFNTSMLNPSMTLFKISVDLLPGRRLSVLAKVVINESNGFTPITYYYTPQDIDIETNKQDDGEQVSSGPHIGLILLVLAIAIFLIILFRVIFRIVRRRMNSNTVQFQLSEQSNQAPAPAAASQPQRQSVRENVGYGEFVEEEVSV